MAHDNQPQNKSFTGGEDSAPAGKGKRDVVERWSCGEKGKSKNDAMKATWWKNTCKMMKVDQCTYSKREKRDFHPGRQRTMLINPSAI